MTEPVRAKVLALFLFPLSAIAAETPVYETIVTAPAESRLPLSRSRIDREKIERVNATSVADLLRTEPGVDFVSDRAGGQSALFLRGGESAHTLVLIDGSPANDPSDPSRRFDFTRLDPLSIESIEILRGPEAIAYGSDALSGVVSIRTKRIPKGASEKPTLEARQEYGTFDTFRSRARAAQRLTRSFGYDLHAYRHSTEGFSAADVSGGDRDARLRISAGARIEGEVGTEQRLALEGEWDQLKEDLDAGAFLDDPNAKSDGRAAKLHASAEGPLLPERKLEYRAEYRFQRYRRFLDDPADPANPFSFSATYVGTTHQGDFAAATEISGSLKATAGGSIRGESAFAVGSETIPEKKQELLGGFLLLEADPAPRWKLDLAGRYDRVNGTNWSEWTGRAGAAWEAVPRDLHLFLGGGTGFKAPSLYQLYAPLYGSRTLEPERSASGEWGARILETASASVFYTHYGNLIEFDSPTLRYRNAGEAEAYGAEIKARHELAETGFSVEGSLTAMRARSLVTKLDLPRRARWKAGADLGYREGAVHLGIAPTFTGSRRDAAAVGAGSLPASVRFDGYAGYRAADWLELGARVDDLFDRRAPEARGYTAPGRMITVSLRAKI